MEPSLQILLGHRRDELSDVDSYFNAVYELSWFQDDIILAMLRDVCGYRGHDGHAITVKDIFGTESDTVTIAMRELPSGVKALLIMWNTSEDFVSATRCGDNCGKWISEFAKYKPLKITLNYPMTLTEFPVKILNNGCIVNNMAELSMQYVNYIGKYYDENMVLQLDNS